MSKRLLRVIDTAELLGSILPLPRHSGRSPELTGPDRGHQGSHLHCAMPSLSLHNDHATIKHNCCTHNDRHCNNSKLRATIMNYYRYMLCLRMAWTFWKGEAPPCMASPPSSPSTPPSRRSKQHMCRVGLQLTT